MKKVSDRIKELRGNLTQTQAAAKLGLTQQAWAKYESGASDPNSKTIKQLCLVFGTTSDWLLGLSDEAVAAEPASARVAELEAENARLRGEVQGLRFALDAVSKGVSRVQASASRGQDASSAS
jgi:transcriptional regulator with XRE-family HTH domain